MQTRSLTKQALSAVEASATRAQTLAQFKEYTNSLVSKYLKDGKSIPPGSDLDTAIDTIITYIDAMNTDLRSWHNDDVDACEACSQDNRNHTCESDHLNASVVEKLLAEVQLVQDARELHATCRGDCWTDDCPVGQCPEYHNFRKFNQSALWSHVVACANPPPGDLADDFIQANEADEVEKLAKMEACLKKAKTWLDPLYEKYKNCEYVANHCPTCQATCDQNQADFENKHCQLDIERGIHCDGYYKCWDADWSKCSAEVDSMLVREKARAADWENGDRIRCLLKVLRDTPDDQKPDALTNCTTFAYTPYGEGNEFYINCSIGTEIPPAHLPCGFSEMQPCDDDFLDFEYHSDVTGLGREPWTSEADYRYIEGQAAGNFNMIGQCKQCIHARTHHWLVDDDVSVEGPKR